MSEKYRVIKLDDGQVLEDGSFFVIREADVFAPQALYGYAHTIQSALELDSLPERRIFSDEEREYLRKGADLLTAQASAWSTTPKKVPD